MNILFEGSKGELPKGSPVQIAIDAIEALRDGQCVSRRRLGEMINRAPNFLSTYATDLDQYKIRKGTRVWYANPTTVAAFDDAQRRDNAK